MAKKDKALEQADAIGIPPPVDAGLEIDLPEPARPEPQKEPAKRRAGLDPEIQALARLDRILEPLSDDQCHRCVLWLMQKYMGGVVTNVRPVPNGPAPQFPIPQSDR